MEIFRALEFLAPPPVKKKLHLERRRAAGIVAMRALWADFGGPSGRDVDMEQIEKVVSATATTMLDTISLRLMNISESGILQVLKWQELTERGDRYAMMLHLDTDAERLEASLMFVDVRNLIALRGNSEDGERRSVACSAAINLLMSPNASKEIR